MMKSIFDVFILSSFLIFASLKVRAQTEGMEIGFRFASENALAIDFAMPLMLNSKRLHTNASVFNGGYGLSGFYDWQFPFAEGFFVYSGPGATASLQSGTFKLSVGGEVGVEYQFIFRLSIGVDYEPMLQVVSDIGYVGGWGVNARWRLSHLLNYRKRY